MLEPPQVNLVLAPPAGFDQNSYNVAAPNEVSANLTLNNDQTNPDFNLVIKQPDHEQYRDNRIEPFSYSLFYRQGHLCF